MGDFINYCDENNIFWWLSATEKGSSVRLNLELETIGHVHKDWEINSLTKSSILPFDSFLAFAESFMKLSK